MQLGLDEDSSHTLVDDLAPAITANIKMCILNDMVGATVILRHEIIERNGRDDI